MHTVSGILKGFDQLINLVLDESKETVRGMCECVCVCKEEGRREALFCRWLECTFTCRPISITLSLTSHSVPLAHSLSLSLTHTDPSDPYRLTEETRDLGLVICRGTQVSLISPVEGTEEISNPFLQEEEEGA
jgi:small nuclear ribonucleoprotein (snRNP)-like protein